jgi:predicted small lipoprotein YifL
MNALLRCSVLALVVLGLSGCGTKGKLKSPSQIAVIEAKKKAKAEKAARMQDYGDDELNLPQSESEVQSVPTKETK